MLTFAHKAKVFLHCLNLFSELKKLGMQLSLRNWAKLLVIWVFVFLLFVFFFKTEVQQRSGSTSTGLLERFKLSIVVL